MKKRFPWISSRKKTSPELPYEPPIWLGTRSNGEYFHPQTRHEKKVRKLILEKADENARRIGWDRREFLASTMGMATSLWCIQYAAGCSSSDSESTSGGSGGSGAAPNQIPPGVGGAGGFPAGSGGSAGAVGGAPGAGGVLQDPDAGAAGAGGGLCVPPEAMYDEQAACALVDGNEFIFDVQTHWFSQEDTVRFPQSILDLFGILFLAAHEDAYINEMFLNSDTDIAVLTSWPGSTCSDDPLNTDPCGQPLSNANMAASRDKINAMACNTQRVIQHVQIFPNDPTGLQKQMDIMSQMHCEQKAHGWKLYPGFATNRIDPRGTIGFFLDEANPRAIIEHGISLGLNLFCVHKGLPIGNFFESDHNYPSDVGVVARDYPQANFVIYHSGICSGYEQCFQAPAEGPYDPFEQVPTGVNALIRSLEVNGIGPGGNVYAEVGSAINEVQANPIAAQHFFGKLMKHFGVDNVVWGTDSVIYGSPQQFIDWMRVLTIDPALQAQHEYPPLDATNKAKIFGLNAARLYGVDPAMARCHINTCATAELKRTLDGEYGGRRWAFQSPGGPKTWDEYVEDCARQRKLGRPG